MLHLLLNLDRSQYEPVLFCHADHGLARLRSGAEKHDIPVRIVPRLQGRPAVSLTAARIREVVDAITGAPALLRVLRSERPDIFHAHLNWPLACRWGLLTAAAAHVPAITATVHLFPPLPNTSVSRPQYRVLSRVVRRFMTVSAGMARRLETELSVPRHRIRVVRNAVPVPAPVEPSVEAATRVAIAGPGNPDSPIVLTVARLTPQKGLVYLLDAAAAIPEAIFAIAGDGPNRDALQKQAGSLGIARRVRFLGNREDVPALLAACNIFVLPSLWEGLPLAVLEAMAAGKPIISTRIEGIAEVLGEGECGILVPPGNSTALAEVIANVLRDASLANRLASAARARAAIDFSPQRMAAQVGAVYEEMLEEPRARRQLAS